MKPYNFHKPFLLIFVHKMLICSGKVVLLFLQIIILCENRNTTGSATHTYTLTHTRTHTHRGIYISRFGHLHGAVVCRRLLACGWMFYWTLCETLYYVKIQILLGKLHTQTHTHTHTHTYVHTEEYIFLGPEICMVQLFDVGFWSVAGCFIGQSREACNLK